MKPIRSVAVALLGLLLCGPARAGVIIQVDENGNGTFRLNGGNPIPLLSTMSVEPNSGIKTLTYALPNPTTDGDVLLKEPGVPDSRSDLLRFFNNALYFFSDNEDGGGDAADVGLPAA